MLPGTGETRTLVWDPNEAVDVDVDDDGVADDSTLGHRVKALENISHIKKLRVPIMTSEH
jgi:hypothetical protein